MHHRLVVTSIVLPLIAAVQDETKGAAKLLNDISRAFARDSRFDGRRLMVGREEQQLQVGRSYAIVDAARISSQQE
jgi:hypothetical protein